MKPSLNTQTKSLNIDRIKLKILVTAQNNYFQLKIRLIEIFIVNCKVGRSFQNVGSRENIKSQAFPIPFIENITAVGD